MEAEYIGARREEQPQFSPRPPSWCPQKRSRVWGLVSFALSFCLSFEISLVRLHFLIGWVEAKGFQRAVIMRTADSKRTVGNSP